MSAVGNMGAKTISSEFKMNECTLEEATVPFSLMIPFSMGSSLKGKNLLPREQILSFKIRPLLKGFYCPGKQTGSQKVVPPW